MSRREIDELKSQMPEWVSDELKEDLAQEMVMRAKIYAAVVEGMEKQLDRIILTPEQRAVIATRERLELTEEDGWTDEMVMETFAYHANLIKEHVRDMWTELTGGFKR